MEKYSTENVPVTGKHRSGTARMAALSSEERSELGKKAAQKRWIMEQENPAKKVLCGSFERPLVIGEIKIPCFVLEDESRIITLEGMKSALGIGAAAGPSARLAEFISAIQLNSAAAVAVAAKLRNPIRFRADGGTKVELAYQSSLLVDLCESILDARLQGQLTDRFLPLATRAELLVRGYARVGLDALIDEATGFQKFRSRTALIELLQKYISDRLLEWTKTFPDEFYTEMFRLKGWDFANLKAGDRKPSIVGRYTRNIVYERMAVPVIHQLEKLNPSGGTGTRKSKHHQFLTREIGHPELKSHIDKVTMLMQLSESWEDFRSKLRKVMPKRWEQFQFNDLLPDPPDAPPTYSDDGLD